MYAEIISIGDELLIGQVVNTNASWMAEQLNLAGIKVQAIVNIGDRRNDILDALALALDRSEVVLVTGGLGPTRDDITRDVLCEFFDTKLIFSQEVFNDLEILFGKRGWKMTDIQRKQAEIPECCTPVPNKNGTAPGMWFETKGHLCVAMPGVPFEMKAMMENYIIPELERRNTGQAIIHHTVLTQGIGESALAAIIKDWEDKLPENIRLAYLPQPGLVRLRLSATGSDKEELRKLVDHQAGLLIPLITDYVFGSGSDTLQEITGSLLRSKNMSLSTSESCTGGYIAHLITSIPGSSDYYRGSLIAYANEIKTMLPGLEEAIIMEHGAVSRQVSEAMATGVRKMMGTSFGLSTTGIAGPGGATAGKPVGTVWISVAGPGRVISERFQFGDSRERNISRTALTALNMLRKEILFLER